MKKMCEILDGLSKITFLSLQRALFNGFDSFSNIDSMRSCSQPPFFGDCQSRHQSEMAMNARHLTGAGTMFLDAFDACLCDFVGGTTWNLQHVRLLSTWIGIPGDQVKSFVFFQLNPAVLPPKHPWALFFSFSCGMCDSAGTSCPSFASCSSWASRPPMCFSPGSTISYWHPN